MSEYNQYVTAINKIFDYLEKMKIGWNNQDNKNYIDSIEEYKQLVIEISAKLKQLPPSQQQVTNNTKNLGVLGND